MTARAALHTLLTNAVAEGEALRELGFTAVYGSNSVDTPTDDKFIIVRWGEHTQAFAQRGPRRVNIWFHDRDQDYMKIDDAVKVVKGLLDGAVHVVGTDGWVITQADWRGDSQDLIDDGFKTQTRYSGYDVVSRYDTN